MSYRPSSVDDAIGGTTTISLRGQNVFNKQPPFQNNRYGFLGYDPENGDLFGRRASLRLEHEW